MKAEILTLQQKASVQKVGAYRPPSRLIIIEISLAFPQFWAGITAMVRCTMRLRTGAGGAVRPIMVLCVTTCITMVVAYIPAATTAATVGAMSGALVKKRL